MLIYHLKVTGDLDRDKFSSLWRSYITMGQDIYEKCGNGGTVSPQPQDRNSY